MNNILEGFIWFWVPASLVICNDVFAYVWGVTIGRTPLIALSPKKTMEGFIGAFFSTMIFGVLWGTYFARFDYMICPVHDLGVSAWSSVKCQPNPVFVWREWTTPAPINTLLAAVSCNWPQIRAPKVIDVSITVRLVGSHHFLHYIYVPPPLHVVLRVPRSAFRRLLCLRLQACIQHQGFWT